MYSTQAIQEISFCRNPISWKQKLTKCQNLLLYFSVCSFVKNFLSRNRQFNSASFSSYLGFCVFLKSKDLKNYPRHRKYYYIMEVTFMFFFCIVKMKFGQILVFCTTSISNMFLSQCYRLETSSMPFYNFIEMAISSYLASFNNWHLPLLIFHYSSFQKKRKRTLDIIGYYVIWSDSQTEKKLELIPSLPNYYKDFWKLLPILLSISQFWWLNVSWFKRYIKQGTLSHVLILIMTSQVW